MGIPPVELEFWTGILILLSGGLWLIKNQTCLEGLVKISVLILPNSPNLIALYPIPITLSLESLRLCPMNLSASRIRQAI